MFNYPAELSFLWSHLLNEFSSICETGRNTFSGFILYQWSASLTSCLETYGGSILPADALGLLRWCAAQLYPRDSHIKPAEMITDGSDIKPIDHRYQRSLIDGDYISTHGLTGNLVNRSENIWEVSGLFLLLIKETSASLKRLDTRSTSTFPINFGCSQT